MQDLLGHIWKPFGDTKNLGANLLASALLVGGWGWFLIQGVRDPLGGINSLWPLFGIANQMLAAIALCLATTIILKMQLQPDSKVQSPTPKVGRPALALVTLIPLVCLLAVTFTAGVEKIFHPDPKIGFLAQVKSLKSKYDELKEAHLHACAASFKASTTLGAYIFKGGTSAEKIAELEAQQKVAANVNNTAFEAVNANRTQRFNNLLDASVAGTFLILVSIIVLISVREWILLLARKRLADLHESEPVWLENYAVAEGKPLRLFGLVALAFALAKELSGEAQLARAQKQVCECNATADKSAEKIYVETTEQRFKGVNRCC